MDIIHRDLKADNVFLTETNYFGKKKLQAKIGDFGSALNQETNFLKNHFGFGTLGYAVSWVCFAKQKKYFILIFFDCQAPETYAEYHEQRELSEKDFLHDDYSKKRIGLVSKFDVYTEKSGSFPN